MAWKVCLGLAWLLLWSAAPCAWGQEVAAPESEPVARLGAPTVAPLVLPDPPSAYVPIRSRLSVRHDFGDGVGYENGFTHLEGFVPLLERRHGLLFGNLRTVNFDHSQLWEFNGGLGARLYNPCSDRILGVHAEYDGRTTRIGNFFHQVTVGFESLGRRLDLRGNVYLPVGNERQLAFDAGFSNPRFSGYNILLDRRRGFEVALQGFDVEAGGPVPGLRNWDGRAFLGCYHYSNEGVPAVSGVRARFEANPCERLSLYASVQNDAVYDTTVSGGFALHFGPGRRTRSLPGGTVRQRLGDRVVRDPNIMMTPVVQTTPTVATDPNTGQPIVVRHVSSSAATEGDGTVEHPYQTLPQLQAGSTPRDILFAHGGSVFADQFITLQPGQRFLGEGIDHLLTSAQGTFLLPRATSNDAMPALVYTPGTGFGDAITLASNTEVAGFLIQDAPWSAIFGEKIENVIVRQNTILRAGESGIYLSDVTGTTLIADNMIRSSFFEAIWIEQFQGASDLTIRNNLLDESGSCQLVVDVGGTATLSATIDSNRFTRGTCITDIGVYVFDDAKANVTVSRNTLESSNLLGIEMLTVDRANLTARILDNQIVAPFFLGMALAAADESQATYQVARNTVLDAGAFSIAADALDKSVLGLQLFGNTVNTDIFLLKDPGTTFRLEDTLGTNVLLGGSVTNVDAGIAIVPFGSLGLPAP